MSKQFMLVLAAIVLVFIGLLTFNKKESSTGNSNQDVQLTEHVYGKADATVKLVEYGDFQCPACAGFYPVIKELKEKYKDQISFQFRHYPLTEIHQNALVSSRAAEAAAKQGKFWEMHDKLFENQKAWETSTNPSNIFEAYAGEIGLDVEKFKQDARSEETNKVVQADRAEARKLGYGSTPTFVLNGEELKNPPSTVEEFSKLIDEKL